VKHEALKVEKEQLEAHHRAEKAELDEMLKSLMKELSDAVEAEEAGAASLEEARGEAERLAAQLAEAQKENLELRSMVQEATEEIEQAPSHEDHESLQRELRALAESQLAGIAAAEAAGETEKAQALREADEERQKHALEVAAHSETRARLADVEENLSALVEEHETKLQLLEESQHLKDHVAELEDALREAVAVVAEQRDGQGSQQQQLQAHLRESMLRQQEVQQSFGAPPSPYAAQQPMFAASPAAAGHPPPQPMASPYGQPPPQPTQSPAQAQYAALAGGEGEGEYAPLARQPQPEHYTAEQLQQLQQLQLMQQAQMQQPAAAGISPEEAAASAHFAGGGHEYQPQVAQQQAATQPAAGQPAMVNYPPPG
jgi:hypothetical protein